MRVKRMNGVKRMLAWALALLLQGVPGFGIDVPVPQSQARGRYYEVHADGDIDDAANLVRELETRMEFYNRIFHFDLPSLAGTMRVRSFRDKDVYDRYVISRLGISKDGAVYLHYQEPLRRELVIHRGSEHEAQVVPHQAFIQYLRAYIPNPPAWIREGFAIYFSNLTLDAEGKLRYEENLAWLDTVRNLGNSAPSLAEILRADEPPPPPPPGTGTTRSQMPAYFGPVSWALVSFFLHSGKEEYLRTLGDALLVLSPQASAQVNGAEVLKRLTRGRSLDTLTEDYRAYISSRRNFVEHMAAGREAYNKGDRLDAEMAFLSAQSIQPDNFAPYYYLGLMAYEGGDFPLAEQYYRSALQYGANPALTYFALGLNAIAAARLEDAQRYFEEAVRLDPDRYRPKVEGLRGGQK